MPSYARRELVRKNHAHGDGYFTATDSVGDCHSESLTLTVRPCHFRVFIHDICS